MKTIDQIVQDHRTAYKKLYSQRTLDAIARRILAGEADFRIGRRSYHAQKSGVLFYSLEEPFVIPWHVLPVPETYWTELTREELAMAVKNS